MPHSEATQIVQTTNSKRLPRSASATQYLRTKMRAALNLAVREGVLQTTPIRHREVTGYREPHAHVWTDEHAVQQHPNPHLDDTGLTDAHHLRPSTSRQPRSTVTRTSH